MKKETRLAELLATRLCHDLTGPIGAISNGVEFLSEDASMHEHAMELITQSAEEAIARLQFYRLAYGRINHNGEVSLSDKRQMVEDFFRHSKIELDWPQTHGDAAGVSVSHRMARLLLNMIIIASSLLIRGGALHIRVQEEDGKKGIILTAEGPTVKDDPELRVALEGKTTMDELTPKLAQPALTYLLAEEIGADLVLAIEGETLRFSALKPVEIV